MEFYLNVLKIYVKFEKFSCSAVVENWKNGDGPMFSSKRHRFNILALPSTSFHSFVTRGAKFETRGRKERKGASPPPTSAKREKVKWKKE